MIGGIDICLVESLQMKNNFIMKLFMIAIAMVSISSCVTTENNIIEQQTVKLKLNWKHDTNFLGFYIAQSQGFYADEGLDLIIEELSDPSLGQEIPSQVLNGEFDFGVAASDLVRAQSNGLELITIGNILKFSPSAFFTRADLNINSPADFAGHSVVVKNLSWQENLEDLLQIVGLSIDDVEVVPGGYDMSPFFDGDVDIWAGFITEEVVRVRMSGIEVVTFPMHEYGNRGGSVFIFTSQKLYNSNSDLAV